MYNQTKTFKAESQQEIKNLKPKFLNDYLQGALDPFSAKNMRIPDISVNSMLPKVLTYMNTITTDAQETGAIVFTPSSRGEVIRQYKQDPITKDLFFVKIVTPNEDLTDDFSAARPVTGALTLVSDTISSTNSNLGGTTHGVSFNDMPQISKLSIQSLSSFKKDDSSAALNIKLSDGIMAVAEPNSNLTITPFTTNAVNPVDVILGAYYFPTPSTVTFGPKFYVVPKIPINLYGSLTVSLHLGYITLSASANPTLWITVTGRKWVNNVLTTINDQRSYAVGHLPLTTPSDFSIEADFDVDFDVGEISVTSAGLVGTCQPDIYFESSQYYSMNTRSPGMIIMYDGCSAGQTLKMTAIGHYEVQPDQKLSKNVNTSYDSNSESFLDMKAVQYVFAHKEKFGIRSLYPLDEYKIRRMNKTFENLASQDYSSFLAGDVSSLVKTIGKYATPLVSGLLSTYNPILGGVSTMIGNSLFASDSFQAGSFKADDSPVIWPPSKEKENQQRVKTLKNINLEIDELIQKRKGLENNQINFETLSEISENEKNDDEISNQKEKETFKAATKEEPIFLMEAPFEDNSGNPINQPVKQFFSASTLNTPDQLAITIKNNIILANRLKEYEGIPEADRNQFQEQQVLKQLMFNLSARETVNEFTDIAQMKDHFNKEEMIFIKKNWIDPVWLAMNANFESLEEEEKPAELIEEKVVTIDSPPMMPVPSSVRFVSATAKGVSQLNPKSEKKFANTIEATKFTGFANLGHKGLNKWGKASGPAIKPKSKELQYYDVYYNTEGIIAASLSDGYTVVDAVLEESIENKTKTLNYEMILNKQAYNYYPDIAMMLAIAHKPSGRYSIQIVSQESFSGYSCLAAIYCAIIGLPYFSDVVITGDILFGEITMKEDPLTKEMLPFRDPKLYKHTTNVGPKIREIGLLESKILLVNQGKKHLIHPFTGEVGQHTWNPYVSTISPLFIESSITNATVDNFSEVMLYLFLLKSSANMATKSQPLMPTESIKYTQEFVDQMQLRVDQLPTTVKRTKLYDIKKLMSNLKIQWGKISDYNKTPPDQRNPSFLRTAEGIMKGLVVSLQGAIQAAYTGKIGRITSYKFSGEIKDLTDPWKTAWRILTSASSPWETLFKCDQVSGSTVAGALMVLGNGKYSQETKKRLTDDLGDSRDLFDAILDEGIPEPKLKDWEPRIYTGEELIELTGAENAYGKLMKPPGESPNIPSQVGKKKTKNTGITIEEYQKPIKKKIKEKIVIVKKEKPKPKKLDLLGDFA